MMTKKVKRLVAGALMAATLGLVAGCGTQDQVGYVDGQTLMTQSQKGVDAKNKLMAKQQEIQKRVAQETQGKSQEEQQQIMAKADQEFSIYQQAIVKDFRNNLDANVQAVAKEKHLTMVVEKNTLISGGEDITNDVLDKMGKAKDASASNGQAAQPAAQPAQSNGSSSNACCSFSSTTTPATTVISYAVFVKIGKISVSWAK